MTIKVTFCKYFCVAYLLGGGTVDEAETLLTVLCHVMIIDIKLLGTIRTGSK